METKEVYELELKLKRLELMVTDLKDIRQSIEHISIISKNEEDIRKAREAEESLKQAQKYVTEAWVYLDLVTKNIASNCLAQKDEFCITNFL